MTTKESKDVRLSVSLDLTGADIDAVGYTKAFRIGECIKRIGCRIMDNQKEVLRDKGGKIRDENGNTIGEWSLDL